jgi:hypothetical protein
MSALQLPALLLLLLLLSQVVHGFHPIATNVVVRRSLSGLAMIDAKEMQRMIKAVVLPMDKISFAYARSSGPGGQNVNKLNTKAEARFHVPSATWLEPEVIGRLMQYQSNKISKEGELIVSSQEFRSVPVPLLPSVSTPLSSSVSTPLSSHTYPCLLSFIHMRSVLEPPLTARCSLLLSPCPLLTSLSSPHPLPPSLHHSLTPSSLLPPSL